MAVELQKPLRRFSRRASTATMSGRPVPGGDPRDRAKVAWAAERSASAAGRQRTGDSDAEEAPSLFDSLGSPATASQTSQSPPAGGSPGGGARRRAQAKPKSRYRARLAVIAHRRAPPSRQPAKETKSVGQLPPSPIKGGREPRVPAIRTNVPNAKDLGARSPARASKTATPHSESASPLPASSSHRVAERPLHAGSMEDSVGGGSASPAASPMTKPGVAAGAGAAWGPRMLLPGQLTVVDDVPAKAATAVAAIPVPVGPPAALLATSAYVRHATKPYQVIPATYRGTKAPAALGGVTDPDDEERPPPPRGYALRRLPAPSGPVRMGHVWAPSREALLQAWPRALDLRPFSVGRLDARRLGDQLLVTRQRALAVMEILGCPDPSAGAGAGGSSAAAAADEEEEEEEEENPVDEFTGPDGERLSPEADQEAVLVLQRRARARLDAGSAPLLSLLLGPHTHPQGAEQLLKQAGCGLLHLDLSAAAPWVTGRVLRRLLRRAPSLRVLVLDHCTRVGSAALAEATAPCPHLAHLSLAGCIRVGDSAITQLCDRAGIQRRLRYLSVEGCFRVTDTSLAHVLSSCTALERLTVRGTGARVDAAFVGKRSSQRQLLAATNVLAHSLREVDVSGAPMGAATLFWIAASCPELSTLVARDLPQLTDSALEQAASRMKTKARFIDVSVTAQLPAPFDKVDSRGGTTGDWRRTLPRRLLCGDAPTPDAATIGRPCPSDPQERALVDAERGMARSSLDGCAMPALLRLWEAHAGASTPVDAQPLALAPLWEEQLPHAAERQGPLLQEAAQRDPSLSEYRALQVVGMAATARAALAAAAREEETLDTDDARGWNAAMRRGEAAVEKLRRPWKREAVMYAGRGPIVGDCHDAPHRTRPTAADVGWGLLPLLAAGSPYRAAAPVPVPLISSLAVASSPSPPFTPLEFAPTEIGFQRSDVTATAVAGLAERQADWDHLATDAALGPEMPTIGEAAAMAEQCRAMGPVRVGRPGEEEEEKERVRKRRARASRTRAGAATWFRHARVPGAAPEVPAGQEVPSSDEEGGDGGGAAPRRVKFTSSVREAQGQDATAPLPSPALGDVGVLALATYCPSLRYLDVSGLPLVTHSSLQEVLFRCRQLRVLLARGVPGADDALMARSRTIAREAWGEEGRVERERRIARRNAALRGEGAPLTEKEKAEAMAAEAEANAEVAGGSALPEDAPIPPEAYTPVGDLPALRALACFQLSDTGADTVARRCTGLVRVEVDAAPAMTDQGLFALLAACPALRELRCAHLIHVSDAGLEAAATAAAPRLRALSLHFNSGPHAAPRPGAGRRVGDRSLNVLLTQCPNLAQLALDGAPMVTGTALPRSARSPRLTHLSLRFCTALQPAGLRAIARACPVLCHMDVTGCPQARPSDVRAVARSKRYTMPHAGDREMAFTDELREAARSRGALLAAERARQAGAADPLRAPVRPRLIGDPSHMMRDRGGGKACPSSPTGDGGGSVDARATQAAWVGPVDPLLPVLAQGTRLGVFPIRGAHLLERAETVAMQGIREHLGACRIQLRWREWRRSVRRKAWQLRQRIGVRRLEYYAAEIRAVKARERAQQQREAATVAQCAVRMWLARRALQQARHEHACYLLVQAKWRGVVTRRWTEPLLRGSRAATKVQRIARGWLTRRYCGRVRHRRAAAMTIQCLARVWLAQRTVERQRRRRRALDAVAAIHPIVGRQGTFASAHGRAGTLSRSVRAADGTLLRNPVGVYGNTLLRGAVGLQSGGRFATVDTGGAPSGPAPALPDPRSRFTGGSEGEPAQVWRLPSPGGQRQGQGQTTAIAPAGDTEPSEPGSVEVAMAVGQGAAERPLASDLRAVSPLMERVRALASAGQGGADEENLSAVPVGQGSQQDVALKLARRGRDREAFERENRRRRTEVDDQHRAAATCLQRWTRGMLARRGLPQQWRKRLLWDRQRASVRIQRVWRAARVRRRVWAAICEWRESDGSYEAWAQAQARAQREGHRALVVGKVQRRTKREARVASWLESARASLEATLLDIEERRRWCARKIAEAEEECQWSADEISRLEREIAAQPTGSLADLRTQVRELALRRQHWEAVLQLRKEAELDIDWIVVYRERRARSVEALRAQWEAQSAWQRDQLAAVSDVMHFLSGRLQQIESVLSSAATRTIGELELEQEWCHAEMHRMEGLRREARIGQGRFFDELRGVDTRVHRDVTQALEGIQASLDRHIALEKERYGLQMERTRAPGPEAVRTGELVEVIRGDVATLREQRRSGRQRRREAAEQRRRNREKRRAQREMRRLRRRRSMALGSPTRRGGRGLPGGNEEEEEEEEETEEAVSADTEETSDDEELLRNLAEEATAKEKHTRHAEGRSRAAAELHLRRRMAAARQARKEARQALEAASRRRARDMRRIEFRGRDKLSVGEWRESYEGEPWLGVLKLARSDDELRRHKARLRERMEALLERKRALGLRKSPEEEHREKLEREAKEREEAARKAKIEAAKRRRAEEARESGIGDVDELLGGDDTGTAAGAADEEDEDEEDEEDEEDDGTQRSAMESARGALSTLTSRAKESLQRARAEGRGGMASQLRVPGLERAAKRARAMRKQAVKRISKSLREAAGQRVLSDKEKAEERRVMERGILGRQKMALGLTRGFTDVVLIQGRDENKAFSEKQRRLQRKRMPHYIHIPGDLSNGHRDAPPAFMWYLPTLEPGERVLDVDSSHVSQDNKRFKDLAPKGYDPRDFFPHEEPGSGRTSPGALFSSARASLSRVSAVASSVRRRSKTRRGSAASDTSASASEAAPSGDEKRSSQQGGKGGQQQKQGAATKSPRGPGQRAAARRGGGRMQQRQARTGTKAPGAAAGAAGAAIAEAPSPAASHMPMLVLWLKSGESKTCVTDITVSFNHGQDAELREKCFEPVTDDLGEYNMRAGARVWIRRSIPDVYTLRREVKKLKTITSKHVPDEQTQQRLENAERRLRVAVAEQIAEGSESGALKRAVELAGLTRADVADLQQVFRAIDRDDTGHASVGEFFDYLNIEPTPFHNHIFLFMDPDNDGVLSFDEFVAAVAMFCMFGTSELARFVFTLFDDDRSGTIDLNEFEELLFMLHGYIPDKRSDRLGVALKEVERLGKEVKFQEFYELHRAHPQLLRPAAEFQGRVMQAVMGRSFWMRKRNVMADVRRRLRENRNQDRLKQLFKEGKVNDGDNE